MNILIATLSILPKSNSQHEYIIRVSGCDEQSIYAAHTNESILKCILSLTEVKQSGGIGKYILLMSNKAKSEISEVFGNITVFDYYKKHIDSADNNPVIKCIDIEDENDEPCKTYEIISSICENIEVGDKVYIDSAGGLRTVTNVVQILSKLLGYIGIDVARTLYANFQNEKKFIVDTQDFDRMLELTDAFNEFMTTGKSKQLNNRFQSFNHSAEVDALLKAMNEFSDRIRLGYVDDIDKVIKRISEGIKECSQLTCATQIEDVVLKQFLPVIKQRLVGDTHEGEGVDYISIVQWCLDNMLIQQAITLFVEKIPISLFQNKCIVYNGNMQEAKRKHALERQKNKSLSFDWEVHAFYSELFKSTGEESISMIMEFARKLKDRVLYDVYKDEKELDSMYEALIFIKNNWKSSSLNSANPIVHRLNEFRKKNHTLTTFEGFLNSLCNEPTSILRIRDGKVKEDSKADKTLDNKFKFIATVKNRGLMASDFSFKGTTDTFVSLLYAYVYVKATRNQINHASSNENLSSEHKSILANYGYTFDNESLTSVEKNLVLAFQAVKDVIQATHMSDSVCNSVIETSPTEYNIGDIVPNVTCISHRAVKIPKCAYSVQVVVPKHYGRNYVLPASFSVKIKQISSKGILTQVEYIPS